MDNAKNDYRFGVFGKQVPVEDAVKNNMQIVFDYWVRDKLDRLDRMPAGDDDALSWRKYCDQALQQLALDLISGVYMTLPPEDMTMAEYKEYVNDYYLEWTGKADDMTEDLAGYEDPAAEGSGYPGEWLYDYTIREAAEHQGFTIPDPEPDDELPFE